ncbi:putative leader peptide [Streptomyces sp. NPDC006622]
MGCETVAVARRVSRTQWASPLLTSRRHIDLLRVCSAMPQG